MDPTGSYMMEELAKILDGNEVDEVTKELVEDDQFMIENRNNMRLRSIMHIVKPKLSDVLVTSYKDVLSKF